MKLLRRLLPARRSVPLDLGAAKVAANPFPHYEALRGGGPIHYLPAHDAWILLGFDEVKAAFARPDLFSNAPYREIDSVLLAADPPDHSAARRLVSRHFTADRVDALSAFARERAAGLAAPELDAVEDYGVPLSRAVAARLIGFDDDALADAVAAIGESLASANPVAALIVSLDRLASRAELFESFAAAVGDRSARSLIRLLWLAATITTQRVIARCILYLLVRPDLRAAIADDETLQAKFIDEVTRLHPPELMVPRMAARQLDLAGRRIPSGALVYLCVAAANRDPGIFESPGDLRLDRPSHRQFAFGSGIHACVGMPLARRVVAAALSPLLEPGARLRPAEPLDRLPHHCSMTACSPTRLRIAL